MFVDIHAHLHFKQFDEDREEVIERAKQSGVVAIVNSGTDYDTNVQVLELAKKHDIIKASLGIYPTYVESISEEELTRNIEFIKKQKDSIISVGEVGLDYHLTKDLDKQRIQRERFQRILNELAPLDKPFVINCRSAEQDVVEILSATSLKKVNFHCFTGRHSVVKTIVDRGWTFSIPANVTRNLQFQQLVPLVPLNQLLTETDAPFLAPPPKHRSEPALVRFAVEKIAELKNVTTAEAQKIIFMNYQRLFLAS